MFAHPSGQWANSIAGKLHHFGIWSDSAAASTKLNRESSDVKDGRVLRAQADDTSGEKGCTTLADVCSTFLRAKADRRCSAALSERSFRDHHRTCRALTEGFKADRRADDLHPEDFAAYRRTPAKRFGPSSLGRVVYRVRVPLRFPAANKLIPTAVAFGSGFDRPGAKALRTARREAGPKAFTQGEATRILDAAEPVMRALLLPALNCGFGNTDVASLPQSAVDLECGWLDCLRTNPSPDSSAASTSHTPARHRLTGSLCERFPEHAARRGNP